MTIRRNCQVVVRGSVLFCDAEGCGVRGPEAPGGDDDAVLDPARDLGWTLNHAGTERDFCPRCVKELGIVEGGS
jgi:hypothetical protein